jgi:hypothetical protein
MQGLLADEHRDRAVGQHAPGLAAEEQPVETAAAVRRHDDEVAPARLGGGQNGWGGEIADLNGGAADPLLLRPLVDLGQDAAGALGRDALELANG